jgi:hypothetical protein
MMSPDTLSFVLQVVAVVSFALGYWISFVVCVFLRDTFVKIPWGDDYNSRQHPPDN